MTLKQIVARLIKEGHKITVYERKDGGILITNIDGKSYTGAQGNAEARALAGEEISHNRKVQLAKIRPKKKRKNASKTKKASKPIKHRKPVIDEDIRKTLLHAQRIWRKEYLKKSPDERQWMGRITMKRVRYLVQQGYSKEEIIRIIQQAEYYARNLTYPENIDHLIARLQATANGKKIRNETYNEALLKEVITKLEASKGKLTEESFKEILNTMYEHEEGKFDLDTSLNKILVILSKN